MIRKIYVKPSIKAVEAEDELMLETSTEKIPGGGHTDPDEPALSRGSGRHIFDDDDDDY